MRVDFTLWQKITAAIAERRLFNRYGSFVLLYDDRNICNFYRTHHYREWPLPFFANDNLERWS